MTNKKNKLLTFLFSLLPGTAHMYMGFMKRGISLMMGFFFIIAIGAFINSGVILFLIPVIWFYSFFDAHNLASMPLDEFYLIEDTYLPNNLDTDFSEIFRKFHKIIAIILIFIGIDLLWRNVTDLLIRFLPGSIQNYFWNITSAISRTVPQVLVGIAIVLAGIYLIKGKKIELDEYFRKNQLNPNRDDYQNKEDRAPESTQPDFSQEEKDTIIITDPEVITQPERDK